MNLPNDVARCDGALGNNCEIAKTCLRFLERNEGTAKVAFYLDGWPFKKSPDDCKHYIQAEECEVVKCQ